MFINQTEGEVPLALHAQAYHLAGLQLVADQGDDASRSLPELVGQTSPGWLEAAMKAIEAFTYLPELAAIGLDKVIIVDYRLPLRYLATARQLGLWISPDRILPYSEVVLPDGIAVIQCSLGERHRDTWPVVVREVCDTRESLGTVIEGLFAYLYGGKSLIKECGLELPGSVTYDGKIPYIGLAADEAVVLGASATDATLRTDMGSMTVHRPS